MGRSDVMRQSLESLWFALSSSQMLVAILGVLFLAWLLWPLRRFGSREYDRCANCGYAVVGLDHSICPECGRDWREVGIFPAGRPSYRSWVTILFTSTLAGAAFALLFGGLQAHRFPHRYRVRYSSKLAFVPGEVGQQTSIYCEGETFCWPWQQTVTAEAECVSVQTWPSPVNGSCDRLQWWPAFPHKVRWDTSANVSPALLDLDGALTAERIVELLHTPPADPPRRTAERAMAEIQNHLTITSKVSRIPPGVSAGGSQVFAIPSDPQATAAWTIRWLCLFLWIVGTSWLYRRWVRRSRIAWTSSQNAAGGQA